jgi:APA family basic amino acid/polyamine antiporter
MTAPARPVGPSLLEACKKRFFLTKSVADVDKDLTGKQHLKRVLGPLDVTTIGIGAIIGAGIFVLSGVAARDYAGPAIIVSFIITAIACTIVAMCYAELSSMIPEAGSAYAYSYSTMGELVAWLIGWDLILEYSVGGIAVAVGWSGYINGLVESTTGSPLPVAISAAPGTVPGAIINLPAMLIVLALTAVLCFGVKESVTFNKIIVIVKVAIVVIFIVVGMAFIHPENYKPFMPFGFAGVMTGAAIVFFAYIGFDAVATVAEEAKDPQRTMPIGIIGSLVVCTILYILVAAVLTGMVPINLIDVNEPLAGAFAHYGMRWAVALVAVGAIAGITSVLLVSLLAQPRVFFALARDGLLPKKFAQVHPKYNTPWFSTVIMGGIIAIFAGITPITTAAELTNIGTLLAFVLVCIGVVILRKKQPNRKRVFKAPLSGWPWPVLPIAGIAFCLALMASLPALTWVRFVGWMGAGLLIYSFYGYKNSVVGKRMMAAENGKPAETKVEVVPEAKVEVVEEKKDNGKEKAPT